MLRSLVVVRVCTMFGCSIRQSPVASFGSCKYYMVPAGKQKGKTNKKSERGGGRTTCLSILWCHNDDIMTCPSKLACRVRPDLYLEPKRFSTHGILFRVISLNGLPILS